MEKEKLFKKIVNIFFPHDIKCIVCDDELPQKMEYSICQQCYNNLPFISGKTCQKCGAEITTTGDLCANCRITQFHFEKVVSVFLYKDSMKELILRLKFGNARYLAEYLGKFLVNKYCETDFNADIVLPVPVYKNRLKMRGYNQSYELAKSFESMGIEVADNVLVKVRDTKSQSNLNGNERSKNLINAFDVSEPERVKGKNVVLIDDIFTTGATVEECSKILKKYKAKNILVITLANRKIEI